MVAATVTIVACAGSSEVASDASAAVPSPTVSVALPSSAATGTAAGVAADWTVVRKEHVLGPERYRLTVILGGQERTLDASRVCYEVTVLGQVLPETVMAALGGYEVVCRIGD